MDLQDDNIANGIDGDQQSDEAWFIKSIVNNAKYPPSSNPQIPRVPTMVRESRDYDKYYVPKVVSISPYHSRNPNLEFVENLKQVFTMTLLSNNSETLRSLYKKLGEPTMVQKLRNFYEKKSTDDFSDKVFTKMMTLDGCFILYYIQYIYGGKVETCVELSSHQIVFVHQDLFLLENQIPFQVLTEVMKLVTTTDWRIKIKPFIYNNILASGRPKRGWFVTGPIRIEISSKDEELKEDFNLSNFEGDHLLQFLHHILVGKHLHYSNVKPNSSFETKDLYGCTFRNVNELIDVGINFKPSSAMHLAQVGFLKRWWWFSANVELPPITVDNSTKPMLLNLIAHEMCSKDGHDEAWVTSYICLLDTLIDHPEDVRSLRKAGVLDNFLGSDEEVVKLFNEIGTDLVPNMAAYSEAKNKIQKHYHRRRNTWLSVLRHKYLNTPWSFIAALALFLSGIQTYFTVWSLKGECDDLCMFLKKNHHL